MRVRITVRVRVGIAVGIRRVLRLVIVLRPGICLGKGLTYDDNTGKPSIDVLPDDSEQNQQPPS